MYVVYFSSVVNDSSWSLIKSKDSYVQSYDHAVKIVELNLIPKNKNDLNGKSINKKILEYFKEKFSIWTLTIGITSTVILLVSIWVANKKSLFGSYF